jgi:ABC-type Zn uptake system ZnuABC Zn-binding protein ZnuA
MQFWNLEVIFIEKLTVREFQEINRLNEKLKNKEIDEITLSNNLSKLVIKSINWEENKETIENLILDMDNIQDYTNLNQEIAKRIDSLVNPLKKKN